MINSRSLSDLLPQVAVKAYALIKLCEEVHVPVIITSTYRDFETQNILYAQGRASKAGPIVTWAKAGDSWHNWKRAFDVVPTFMGKPCWRTTGVEGQRWQKVGELGRSLGLEWGGDWLTRKDYPHFQLTEGHTLAELKKTANL